MKKRIKKKKIKQLLSKLDYYYNKNYLYFPLICSFSGILFIQRPAECKPHSFINGIKRLERLLKECEKYNESNKLK
jgi:hypothetical protein